MKSLVLILTLIAAGSAQDCADELASTTLLIGVSGTPPPQGVNAIEVNLDGPLSLSCIDQVLLDRNGNTLTIVSYSWYLNGVRLSITSSSIEIESVRGTNGGVYECSITTTICTTQRSSAFTVNVSPDLMIVAPSSPTIEVMEGQSFSLNCQAPGWPSPTVQWFRNASDSLALLVADNSIYTVRSARPSDAGIYSCIASNRSGSINDSRSVLVAALPPTTTADEVLITTDPILEIVNNGTDHQGFYIAVGVTAGVSLVIGVLSLFCCIITLYVNCCYKPKVEHNPYEDWPDGEEGDTGRKVEGETANQSSPDHNAETVELVGAEETAVVAVYQDASEDEFDRKTADMRSPSEIGDIV